MAYIVMLVITIIAFLILYNRSSLLLENKYIDGQLVALRQVSIRMDDNLAEIMNASILATRNTEVRSIAPLVDPFSDTNVIRLIGVKYTLGNFQAHNPLLSNFFLAYDNGGVAVSSHVASSLEHFYARYMQFNDLPYQRWLELIFYESHRSRFVPAMSTQFSQAVVHEFIQYITPIPGASENRSAAVSLISNRAIHDKFLEMNIGENGSIFIVSAAGEMISVVTDSLELHNLDGLTIGREGSERFYRGGIGYIMSYTTSGFLNWTYVSIVRSDYVLAELNTFRRSLLSVLLVAMVATIALSVIFSMHHAQPMKKLEDVIAAHMPILQHSFFYGLFNGKFYEESDAKKDLELLGLNLDGALYKTVIVKMPDADSEPSLDNLQNLEKLLMLLDEYTRTYVDMNIRFHPQTGRSTFITLFMYGGENIAGLDRYVMDFCNWLAMKRDEIGSISVGIGGTYHTIIDVHKSYEEAEEAIQYYTVLDSMRVLCVYDEIPRNKEFYYYPEQEEQRLINMVKSGDTDGVRGALNAICSENLTGRQLSNNMIAAFINHLRQGIVKIDRLNLIVDEKIVEKINDSYETFHHITDLLKLKLCTQLYMEICESLHVHKQNKLDALMPEIKQFVEDNYHDPDISLTSLADRYGMSETYFSLRFKEYAGENFFNYVQSLRINKVIKLLETSKLPIQEICERVGYSNYNTFAKAFKRITGVSAGEYRKNLK